MVAAGGAALFAGRDEADAATPSVAARSTIGKPVRGGTFTVGMLTAGTDETINPAKAVNVSDLVRITQLYDQLFTVGPNLGVVPTLALSAEPNKDASVYTIKLRDGVKWHDGTPFSADDVVWTMHWWNNPNSNAYGVVAPLIDFNKVRKINRLTVEVPLKMPAGEFVSVLTNNQQVILKAGTTEAQLNSHPIGTGPFKFQSFTPGQQSVFVANPHYWQEGKPYVAKLVMNTSFADEKSRQEALLSGAINISPFLPPLVFKSLQTSSGVKVLRALSNIGYSIIMRVDKGPFADVRVRQAMKHIIDRPAMIEASLGGYGVPGNDLLAPYTEYFLNLRPFAHDPERARSLLKAAGQEGMSFAFPTANFAPAAVPSATIFAEQAAKAGVKVNVQVVSPSTYYTSSGGFLTRPIGVDTGSPQQSLTVVYLETVARGAPFNESWWGHQPGGAASWKLIGEAIAATDPARAKQLWAEVQHQIYSGGGYINWVNTDDLAAVASNVHGLQATLAGYMNYARFLDGWIVN